MLENRGNLRARKAFNIKWEIIGSELAGEGNVLNISQSGALIQTDRIVTFKNEPSLRITPTSPGIFFQPKEGNVVWFRKVQTPQPSFLVGLRFSEDTRPDRDFTEWLQKVISELADINDSKILEHYLN